VYECITLNTIRCTLWYNFKRSCCNI